jgi:hypothetical protein
VYDIALRTYASLFWNTVRDNYPFWRLLLNSRPRSLFGKLNFGCESWHWSGRRKIYSKDTFMCLGLPWNIHQRKWNNSRNKNFEKFNFWSNLRIWLIRWQSNKKFWPNHSKSYENWKVEISYDFSLSTIILVRYFNFLSRFSHFTPI